MQGQKAHQKYINLCSEDEQRSYEFRVINDNFHFQVNYPFKYL